MNDDINLRITGVEAGEEIEGALRVTISTTSGPIPLLLHRAAQPGRAVLCVSGASGGYNGPAGLFARLGAELPASGINVARINYRAPGEFSECLLDAMAALSFLGGTGNRTTAVIGHSFGGAVAINAGTLGRYVSAVVAISSQLAGAHVVDALSPRPLLLVHGTADVILPQQSSEMIFERAGEPKTLKLIEGADHIFMEHGDELFGLVSSWLAEKI